MVDSGLKVDIYTYNVYIAISQMLYRDIQLNRDIRVLLSLATVDSVSRPIILQTMASELYIITLLAWLEVRRTRMAGQR